MKAPYYEPTSRARPERPMEIPRSVHLTASRPEDYVAEPGLVAAVNTALLLGQPLLLTGEPGTGKTQLAASVAHQLGYPPPLRFDCKSTSQARDVFYTFDALGRFKDREQNSPDGVRSADVLRYIHYQALGRAILFANPPERVRHLLPPGLEHPGQTRSVILVDEVDKAPRDFPNDLLSELEEMCFFISELNETVSANGLQPILIITSNSERDLPDAFLRRCAYYDIPFPSKEVLTNILEARLKALEAADAVFIQLAVGLFNRLRASDLSKKPATAELIGWMVALRRAYPEELNPLADRTRARGTIGALIKTREDLRVAHGVVEAWAKPT